MNFRALVAACALVLLPVSADARDTLTQVESTNLHLSGGGARVEGVNVGSASLAVATPLEGFIRGMHLQFGGAAFFAEHGYHVSIPLVLRYTFLTGTPVAPHLSAGTGYYFASNGGVDHGLQLVHAGCGVSYFFAPSIALGLGLDSHLAPVSLSNKDVTQETSWFTYGLRLTFVP